MQYLCFTTNTEVIKTEQVSVYSIVGGGRGQLTHKQVISEWTR